MTALDFTEIRLVSSASLKSASHSCASASFARVICGFLKLAVMA